MNVQKSENLTQNQDYRSQKFVDEKYKLLLIILPSKTHEAN